MNNTLTALAGVKVGHSTHKDKLTGCTVVLFDEPYPVAYKSYGGCAVTYNTDSLEAGKADSKRNGIFISGGSELGITSGTEISKELIKRKIGFNIGTSVMPAISGAVVYDIGTFITQYDPIYGKEATINATRKPVERGNVGAGTGTHVGKFIYGKGDARLSMKAGVGCARVNLGSGIIVCAVSVVNAVGNVVLPNGKILAGNRKTKGTGFESFHDASLQPSGETNTTISIVGTNADLQKQENYERVAHLASHGQARAIDPINTSRDGDTVFVFSTGRAKDKSLNRNKLHAQWRFGFASYLGVDIIGSAAAKAVQESIYDACRSAESVHWDKAYKKIVPSIQDY